jgi:hypothetical protein
LGGRGGFLGLVELESKFILGKRRICGLMNGDDFEDERYVGSWEGKWGFGGIEVGVEPRHQGDMSFVSTNHLMSEAVGSPEISEFKLDELATGVPSEPQHGPSFGTLETLPMETEADVNVTQIRIRIKCPVLKRVLKA